MKSEKKANWLLNQIKNYIFMACCLGVIAPLHSQTADRLNIELVGHSDLNGAGKGGEGLALKNYGNQKILFLAHESGPLCFSVIDVTNPSAPKVIKQLTVEDKFVRCNSLALTGNTLIVARQTELINQPHGGVKIYNVTHPENPQLESYIDLTGPSSRGTHYVTAFGNYAFLSTGAKDFIPQNQLDDQMLMIVDISNPQKPTEINRWWMPGTKVGDTAPPVPRAKPYDSGYRLHTLLIPPGEPNRAYMGWIDGGMVVLDITDLKNLKPIAQRSWQSSQENFHHTVLSIPERKLIIVSQEATRDNCEDWPKRVSVMDNSIETRPYPIAYFPPPQNIKALCNTGGRFGAHNINQNTMTDVSKVLRNTVVTAQFAGGLRIYSIKDPYEPKEIGFFAAPVQGNKGNSIQMNDLIVGSDGLIYANDRFNGGLFILKYTGSIPLD